MTFTVIALYIWINLYQCEQLLSGMSGLRKRTRIASFISKHNRLFVLLCAFDKNFGRPFTYSLGIQAMSSLFASNMLFAKQMVPVEQGVISLIIFHAFLIIIVAHFLFASFTKRLHRCARLLMQINLNSRSESIESKWKLASYIEKFHTKKRYGFTYAGLGLITMFSFAKVCPSKVFDSCV